MIAARERELITNDVAGTKLAVRDAVRRRPGGELEWQALQADVYGELIWRAKPFPGVRDFFVRARALGAHVTIVSHKTVFATARPTGANLRDAASKWLCANGLVGSDLVAARDVYFEGSRRDKLARIRTLEAQIVIDDLVEVLTDPDFPPDARRWLFSPGDPSGQLGEVEYFGSWKAMAEALDQ